MAQTSTNQLGAAGQAYATNAGEAIGAAGQARASGYMGTANAVSQGLTGYLNYSQGQQRNALIQRQIDAQKPYGTAPSGGGGGYLDPYARFSYGEYT